MKTDSSRFSKKVIVSMLIGLVIYVAIVLFNFIRTGMEPTHLTIGFFGLFVGQFSLMAWLTRGKRNNETALLVEEMHHEDPNYHHSHTFIDEGGDSFTSVFKKQNIL